MDISKKKDIYKLIWKNSKIFLLLISFFKVLEGLMPALQIWLFQNLLNQLPILISGSLLSKEFILLFSLYLFSLILPPIIGIFHHRIELLFDSRIQILLENILFKKILSIPFYNFELPTFYNLLNRIFQGSYHKRVLEPINTIFILLSSISTLISLFILLTNIDFLIGLLSLITFIPSYLINSKFGKQNFQLSLDQTKNNKEMSYIKSLFQSKESVKEIKLLDLGNYLITKWEILFNSNFKKKLKVENINQLRQLILQFFNIVAISLAFLYLLKLVGKNEISIGIIATIPQIITSFQYAVINVASNTAQIVTNQLYIDDLLIFLGVEENKKSGIEIECTKKLSSIENVLFKNVSYSYPNSKKKALNNVSIDLYKNEKVAIIGENGSGKSTLLKCLVGLYDVSEGIVQFNKVNINLINDSQLRKNISVMFQDYTKYEFSLKENIIFGDLKKINKKAHLKLVSKLSGINSFLNSLPEGYNTKLGNMIGMGTDLSGGQWQKVALARLLFRDASLVVLDEPTSAFDPNSEYQFYKNLNKISNDKIIIYVTHRIAAAKLADKIIVLKNGEVIEVGTHDELIIKQGEYYDMYMKQNSIFSQE